MGNGMSGDIDRAILNRYEGVLLIDQTGRFLTQERDAILGIGYPGRVTLFGGTAENGENSVECAVCELREKTGVQAKANELELLAQFTIIDEDGSRQDGALFMIGRVVRELMTVTEGRLLEVRLDELDVLWPRMTPEASHAVKLYIGHLQRRGDGQ